MVNMPTQTWTDRSDGELVTALRDGNEDAFVWLVCAHQRSMERVAHGLVRDVAVAHEVVQETWEAVVKGIDDFRGEAALKTWIFRILVNRARRATKKESRSTPLSVFERPDDEGPLHEIADRFNARGGWASPVTPIAALDPENRAVHRQGVALLKEELEKLPEQQRIVVTLRDVEELESSEVCEMLGISEGNQRVILHRGRTRLRQALEAAEQTGSLDREEG